jgi:predicted nucleotidyltransferase
MDINVPKIDTIISIIGSIASPDQIILFGSYARGDNTPKSDIDLLILKKGLKKGREICSSIYRAFLDNHIGIPVDVLAIDYNRYLELNNEIGYIYKTIKEQGKVIYGPV